jgi:hypothetical protein
MHVLSSEVKPSPWSNVIVREMVMTRAGAGSLPDVLATIRRRVSAMRHQVERIEKRS